MDNPLIPDDLGEDSTDTVEDMDILYVNTWDDDIGEFTNEVDTSVLEITCGSSSSVYFKKVEVKRLIEKLQELYDGMS